MKIKKLIALLCMAAPVAVIAATGDLETSLTTTNSPKAAVDADTLFTNSVIAKGQGVSVTRSQLDEEIIRIKSLLAAQGRVPSGDEMAGLEGQVLESLIGKQLISAKATPEDRAKGKAEFDKAVQKIKTNGKLTDEQYTQKLNQQLRLLNVTKEEWEKQSAEQAMIPIVLAREMGVKITDADVKKFYDENPAKFEQPEKVRAAHILLMTSDPTTHADLSDDKKAEKKKQIEDLLKRARAGEDFAKLAKDNSEDPGSKDNGGEYTFPRGQMVPEFEAAAFSLKTNEVSDVITTQFGYHIIKLYEKIPAKKVEFSEVSSDIQDFLTQQALQKGASDLIVKLKKEANVEILDPKLKAAAAMRQKMEDSSAPAVPPSAK